MEIPPEILSDAEFDARELVARVQRLAPVLVAHRMAVAAELDHDLRRLVDADGRPAHRATADLLADAADTAVRRTRALTDDPRWRHAVDTP